MNGAKATLLKFAVSLLLPLIIVTLGGLLVYGSFNSFFFVDTSSEGAEVNGPAVIYYALTCVVALMYFFMRMKYTGYEFIALTVMSLIYSLSLQKLTPAIHRLLILYFLPLIVIFLLLWLILRFIIFNRSMRAIRLLLFALLGSGVFTLTFSLQMLLLHQQVTEEFLQGRFFSGLLLFVFMGFGLSLADDVILKLDEKQEQALKDISKSDNSKGEKDESD
ncbi:MAG: hypothetical protein ACE14O_02925 [Candidatus Cloacimonadaceae bacterium]